MKGWITHFYGNKGQSDAVALQSLRQVPLYCTGDTRATDLDDNSKGYRASSDVTVTVSLFFSIAECVEVHRRKLENIEQCLRGKKIRVQRRRDFQCLPLH